MAQCGNLGLGIGLLATVGILYCLGSRYWQVNSQVSSDAVNRGLKSYEGLWVRCLSYVPGAFQCDNYDESYLALPAYLTALRGMMIVSCIFSVIGFAIMAFSLDCNANLDAKQRIWARRVSGSMVVVAAPLQCQRAFMVIAGICSVAGLVAGALGQDCIHAVHGKPKIWSGRAGGILMLAAGLLTLTSVSWYAAEVVKKYWEDEYNGSSFRYEFGAALYIGWVASGLALVSGGLMACCTCGGEDEEDGYHYNYNPPKAQAAPSRHAEYV